jgi:hypothetical protein
MLARYAPGLGDPMGMTLPDLQEWHNAVAALLEREFGKPDSGATDHRARVEAEMRRLHG